jgi:hypothetical protein
MISAAKAAANAANAQLSTGPRTEEGKAISSRNALKHGLTSQELIVREDEQHELNELHESLRRELSPEGAIEELTFKTIIHAAWTMHRCRRAEADLFVNGLDPILDDSSAKVLDRIHRYASQAERSYFRHLKELRVLQTNRALRNLKLDPEEAKQCPTLVSYNDVTKRSHAQVQAEAMQMAINMLDYEAKTLTANARREWMQNKATNAAPKEANAA